VPDRFFCFSSSSALPSASDICLRSARRLSAIAPRCEGEAGTHDLTGIARVAETENARTGALKADRKMLVDWDSMLVWVYVLVELANKGVTVEIGLGSYIPE
jgi:hypothetical protein